MIRHNRYRLPEYDYSKAGSYFVTFCCRNRIPVFQDKSLAQAAFNYFDELYRQDGDAFSAILVMPDHIHLVIDFKDHNSVKLGAKIRELKIGSWLAIRDAGWVGERLWQRGYYDHVIRNDADWIEKIQYIMGNPVKAGLVESISDWPFIRISDIE